MPDLIPLHNASFGTETFQTVNARELHAFLEVGVRFNDWIIRRIAEFAFEEGRDFTLLKSEYGTPKTKDYFVTLDMAKELSMVERTAKGKEARQYFIAVEKSWREKSPLAAQTPATQIQLLLAQVQLLAQVEEKQRLLKVVQDQHTQDIADIRAALPDPAKQMSVKAFANCLGVRMTTTHASRIGKRCAGLSRAEGRMIGTLPDETYGQVNTYDRDILQTIFQEEFPLRPYAIDVGAQA